MNINAIKKAILTGDIEALKELKQEARPVVVVFKAPGEEPSAYYVAGQGLMTKKEFENYKSLQKWQED